MPRTKFSINLPCRCCQRWHNSSQRTYSTNTEPHARACPKRSRTTEKADACDMFILADMVWCYPSDNWVAPEMCINRTSANNEYSDQCRKCGLKEGMPAALTARALLTPKEEDTDNGDNEKEPAATQRTRRTA